MSIALGSDHAGFALKELVKEYLQSRNIAVTDMGCYNADRVDYPDFAVKVAKSVVAGDHEFGVLVCGTGIGISITANKIKGVRAALCCNEYMAEKARQHNDANILALGGRTTTADEAKKIVDKFLSTSFEGGRHKLRVDKIHDLTGK